MRLLPELERSLFGGSCLSTRRVLFALALAVLLSVSLIGLPFAAPRSGLDVLLVHADDPKDRAASEVVSSSVTNRSICIAASDDGPYFSLSDLENYTPPPPRLPAWKIKPTIWKEYPAELKSVFFVGSLAPRMGSAAPLRGLHSGLAWGREYPSETVNYLAEHEIRYGDREGSYVALTFDCEMGTHSTRRILETLREEDVRATFFVQGKYVYLNPEIVREMVADGHELGSHSFFHPLFTDLSPIAATQEITYTEAAVAWAVGEYVPMRYFRFPYGRRDKATRMHIAALGYQSAFWDLDPRGWESGKSAEDVVEYIRRTAHRGGIVIMHCGCWDDANALSGVIQAIREKGLIPGTLSDALTEEDRNVPGYSPPSPP